MVDFLANVASEIATVLYEGSFYILIGFLIAGVLNEFMPAGLIARYLGNESPRSVALAALFGAPIPLCSCGVLPAAAGLRRGGAGKSSTLSFLISTPETGVDSIALTYALLGPVMAVVRPVVAVVTGTVAGILSIAVSDGGEDDTSDLFEEVESLHDHDHCPDEECIEDVPPGGARNRVQRVMRYGFTTLLDELAFWIVVGITLTGLLGALLPDDFFSRVLGWDSGILPMLAMIVVGAPLYLCASASTPVAAALIAKGLSPGAALVFLLVGPATNAATMTVVGQLLGLKRLKIYIGTIIGVSLAAGLLLDAFGGEALRRTALDAGGPGDSAQFAAVKTAAAVIFILLLTSSLVRTGFHDGIGDLRGQLQRLAGGMARLTWRDVLRGPVLLPLAALLLIAWAPRFALIVEPGRRGIIQQFGTVSAADLEPGMYFHLPPPLGRGIAVDVERIREANVGYRGPTGGLRSGVADQAYYLTADENIIDVRSTVFYRVSDATRFALGIENAADVIHAVARRQLVDVIGSRSIDLLYTTERRATERALVDAIARSVDALDIGCEILDARLLDVHAPSDVHDAFRDVSSALEDKQRTVRAADGYAASLRAVARGEAGAAISKARADAVTAVRIAEGRADAFAGLAAAYANAPAVTGTRLYLETVERALPEVRKYINGAAERVGDIDLWVGAPEMILPGTDLADTEARRERDAGNRKTGNR
jgi:HflK protein